MPLILEGIVTTHNPDRSVNISPMGPMVDREVTRMTLRPYQTSTTYRNLQRTGHGVFHVVDDVELLARAAVGNVAPPPPMAPCDAIDGMVLRDACRWFAIEVISIDASEARTTVEADVVASASQRDFFGFNRAKHAVLEAAILATRIDFLPPAQIQAEMQRLAVPVEKTAGGQEERAFRFLTEYIATNLGPSVDPETS